MAAGIVEHFTFGVLRRQAMGDDFGLFEPDPDDSPRRLLQVEEPVRFFSEPA